MIDIVVKSKEGRNWEVGQGKFVMRKGPKVAREEKCRSEQGSMGKAIAWWQG